MCSFVTKNNKKERKEGKKERKKPCSLHLERIIDRGEKVAAILSIQKKY